MWKTLLRRSGLEASLWTLKGFGLTFLNPFKPNSLEVRLAFGHAHLADIPETTEARPLRAIQLAKLGELYEQKKDYPKSLGYFQQAVELFEAEQDAQYLSAALVSQGGIYMRLEQWEAGLASFEQAILAQPDSFDAHNMHAWCCAVRHQNAAAIASYQRALALNPQDDEAWFCLGCVCEAQAQLEDAVAAYRHAAELKPAEPKYARHLAYGHKLNGQWALAQEWFRRELSLTRDDKQRARAHLNLGDTARALGQWPEARAEFEWALQHDPALMTAHVCLAAVCKQLGDEAKWTEHLNAVSSQIVSVSEYDRACYEAVRGDVEAALAFVKTALDKKQATARWAWLDPDLASLHTEARFVALCAPSD